MAANDDLDGLIPHGTKVKARLTTCARTRFFTGEVKDQYMLYFRVLEGPHAGKVVTRCLWDSQGGRSMLYKDSQMLGVKHPEDLCVPGYGVIEIEGNVSLRDDPFYGVKNELWIERSVPPGQLQPPIKPACISDRNLPEPF